MSPDPIPSDIQLEVLHDHYKETFARIREAEKTRDRLFLVIIGLFALLIVEVGYPAAVGGTLGTVIFAGVEFNLKPLPLPALLNATWVLVLTIALKYCQTSVLINRQYPYLHRLEDTISPAVGGEDIYQREGKVYLQEYPLLLNVAWIAYGILFPAITIFAAAALIWWEFAKLNYPVHNKIFDALIAALLVFVFVSYRVHPTLVQKLNTWHKSRKLKQS